MSIVNDPDTLDRWQTLVDPVAKTLSIRGLGTEMVAASTDGSSAGTTTFTSAGSNFTTSSVVTGDILTIFSDPANDGAIIGHYVIDTVGTTTVTVDRTITTSTAADLDFKVNNPEAQGGSPEAVADGVAMQAVYSFLKEEWRTKSGPTGGEDLIKYPFPIVSITSEQFEIGGVNNSNWDFADDSGDGANASESPRNLIRTGGWSSINSAGEIINNYPSIITLGTLDSDAQVYYQQTSATTTPVDFVLTGTVNQSIKTLEVTGGVTTNKVPTNRITNLNFVTTTTVRDAGGGDFTSSGFVIGDKVQIRNTSTNNGFYTISNISNDLATNDLITITGSTFTTTGADATAYASPVTDNRDYLVLRVRKKAKSYVQSEIADIGVTQIVTIVNRFPLSHADDPAIVLDDGALSGDGTNVNFQVASTVESGTDGVISDPTAGDGLFTFTSATALWNTGGVGSQLYVGDALEITEAADAMLGTYEVSSVTSDTVVVLIEEPGRGVTTGSAKDYTARSSVRAAELADGSTADSGTAGQGTFTSLTATFSTDGVVADDILRIKSGTSAVEGIYKVISVTSETILEVDTIGAVSVATIWGDQDNWPAEATLTYDVLQKGMHLQFKSEASTAFGPKATNGVDFGTNGGNTIQIKDTPFDWESDYTFHIGGTVTVASAENTVDNGTYIITNITTITNTNDLLTVLNTDGTTPSFTVNTQDTAATFTGEYGFIRSLNGVDYSFNWRILGNGGTLAEVFQFLQQQLRLTSDIDEGDGTARGDITDLLMSFTSPNGTTLNLFIDDLDSTKLNNVTMQDLTGTNRNFAFIAGLTITLNTNILSAATNKIVVFFSDADTTPANGDEFGTPGAITINDKDAVAMEATDQTTSPLSFSFDYTNNAQGGRTPATDAAITVVCITDDTGQYVSAQGTITQVNETTVALVAGLERNYSNP